MGSILSNKTLKQALKIASKKLNDGDLASAIEIYQDILVKYPGNVQAKRSLSGINKFKYPVNQRSDEPSEDLLKGILSYYSKTEYQSVVDAANNLKKQYPKSVLIRNISGLGLIGLEKYAAAEQEFQSAIILKPEFIGAYTNLAATLKNLGKIDEAIRVYTKVINMNPQQVEAHINLGSIYCEQKCYTKALKHYDAAIKLRPDHPVVHFNLANLKREIGFFAEAITSYKRAIYAQPKYPVAYNNMGLAYLETGEEQLALDAFSAALKLQPSYPEALNNLGCIYKNQFSYSIAIKAFENAIEIKPDYVDALNNLGIIYSDQRKYAEATAKFQKCFKVEPRYAGAYNNYGVTLSQMGEYDEAVKQINCALELTPNNSEAYNNLANTYKASDQVITAISAYVKAVEIDPNHEEAVKNIISLATQLLFTTESDWSILETLGSADHFSEQARATLSIQRAIQDFMTRDFESCSNNLSAYREIRSQFKIMQSGKEEFFNEAYYNYLIKLITANANFQSVEYSDYVYHVGESHCLSYAHSIINISNSRKKIKPLITFGAKAHHLSQPSNNQFKSITRYNLRQIPPGADVFISFGEIDCRSNEGFLKAIRKSILSRDVMVDNTVEKYLDWVVRETKSLKLKIYFLNVPAPVKQNDEIGTGNDDVKEIIKLFNTALAKHANRKGLTIIDTYDATRADDGFSNSKFHIDSFHLSPTAISIIQKQLCTLEG